jgi:hypothetical protein
MKDGGNQYAHSNGVPALREALSEKIHYLYNSQINPETEITITPGGTYALYTAFTTIIEPGDAVIPSVKILMNKQTLGFTYDIYNSNITQARLRQNTFELSFSTSIGNKRGGLLRTIYD